MVPVVFVRFAQVAVDLLRLAALGGEFKWVLKMLFCCSRSCQYVEVSNGQTETIKLHADFFFLMPIALPVLYRADWDFEGDDISCRVLWTAFHLEGRDAGPHVQIHPFPPHPSSTSGPDPSHVDRPKLKDLMMDPCPHDDRLRCPDQRRQGF